MLKACQIPNYTINNISTTDLVKTVLNYPLYMNIYAYNSTQQGFEAISKQFNGLVELLKRKDATKELLNVYKSMDASIVEDRGLTEIQKGNHIFKLAFLEILLAQDEILLNTNRNEVQIIQNEVLKKYNEKRKIPELYGYTVDTFYKVRAEQSDKGIQPLDYTTTVQTPNGTPVSVYVISLDFTSAERTSVNNYFTQTYPLAKLVSGSTKKYNCHSYAWYYQSTSNSYWMDDPSPYINDGSYSYVGIYPTGVGQKAYYSYGEHSAIVINYYYIPGDYTRVGLRSKWGQGPLMEHAANYSPYTNTYGSIQFYRR